MIFYTALLMSTLVLTGCVGGTAPAETPMTSEAATIAYIQKHVEAMWFRPEGSGLPGKGAGVEVRLDASGRVESTKIIKSSGNAAFDASLERAVKRAAPFPLPKTNPEKFRRLELYFKG
jgi:colicin import membrane protein